MRWPVVLRGWLVELVVLLVGCDAPFGIAPTLPAGVDPDHDGFADRGDDNCPGVANPDQADANHDGIGDACSTFCTGTCSDPARCACADFDGSRQPPADWDLVVLGSTAATVTTGDVRSPPHALDLHAPPGPAAGMQNLVTFSHGLLATRLHIVYDTDWKLSYFAGDQQPHSIQFLSVFLENIANVGLAHDFDGVAQHWYLSVAVVGQPGQPFQIPRPPTDEATWVHVQLDVQFDPDGHGHAYLDFNGAPWLHKDNLVTAPPITGAHTLSAVANVWCLAGTTPDIQVAHDNLVMRVD